MRFANFLGRSPESVPEPLFKGICIEFTSKWGFRTPSPKVCEPHFLWFGLPELLLKHINININKVAGLSRDCVGAKNLFMCFFSGHSLGGRKKRINKIPPKIPGQSRETFVYVFFFVCLLRPQHKHKETPWGSPAKVLTLQIFMWAFFSWKTKEKGPPT